MLCKTTVMSMSTSPVSTQVLELACLHVARQLPFVVK